MIQHILLLEPKPETTAEEMQEVLVKARALREKIPGLVAVLADANKNIHNHGYTYGMIMSFIDEDHMQAYFPHPEHRAVSSELRRLCVNLLNFDILQENM